MYRSRPSDDRQERPRPSATPQSAPVAELSSGDSSEVLEAIASFKERMTELVVERTAINQELGQVDLLGLSRRTRDLALSTRQLLDNNVHVLFAAKATRMADTLFAHLDYADNHIVKALSEEYEFEVIKQRLYMATSLVEFVVRTLDTAVTDLEAKVRDDLA